MKNDYTNPCSASYGITWSMAPEYPAEGQISLVERDVIAQTLSSYYSQYFSGQQFLGLSEKEKAAIKQEVQWILSASMIKDLADTLDLTHEIEETDPDAYSLPVDWQIPAIFSCLTLSL